MNKRKKDESQATYITEGISFGTFLGVVLSVVIDIIFGFGTIWWTWAIFPGFGMLLGIIVGKNIEKK